LSQQKKVLTGGLLKNDYVSITPLRLDLTDEKELANKEGEAVLDKKS
jgi:broad specificity polyphosphatase/5'/3'-nucleotidase SurE